MIELTVSQVVSNLMALAASADRAGQASVHGACFAAAMMLVDAAGEDGVEVDPDAVGFMFGSFEG